MNDNADRRFDRQGDRARDRVIDVDKFDAEAANLEEFSGVQRVNRCCFQKAVPLMPD
jgi:hypothetical protein